MSIGNKIKSLMVEKGISLDILSKHTGYPKPYLSMVLKDQIYPKKIGRIEKCLGSKIPEEDDMISSDIPVSSRKLLVYYSFIGEDKPRYGYFFNDKMGLFYAGYNCEGEIINKVYVKNIIIIKWNMYN